ncbi:MAG: MurR/RpiR family transcriptional regulator [candidate division KSB1 bacterium]|jgi:DNA-binding MurR/RpiR family transcriptional regulator|nr:MurR/RpiR family transcriptional regulator [candidate division KSB1 bacterium]
MSQRKKIEKLIFHFLPTLSPNLRKVADYILENMNVAALLSVKDVSTGAGVSEATVVRFAQTLGYNGYKEMKNELSLSLKNSISPTEHFQHAITERSQTPDVLKLTARSVINNINDTVKSIGSQDFSHFIEHIIEARRIYCLGLEISHHFSQLMTFLLRLYSYDAHSLSTESFRFKEQIAFFNPDDLLIAFSFSPYSRETIEAVAYARDRDVPCIAITDKRLAPIMEFATHAVQIKTDNITFTNSWGAVAVLINAIVTELNFKDKERTLNALKIIEETIKDDTYYIN